MGVFANPCALCALPLELTHYVEDDPSGVLRIWRRGDPDPGFDVDASYHWLDDVVALGNGAVKTGYVFGNTLIDADGHEHDVDGDVLLHAACHRLLGAPRALRITARLPHDARIHGASGQLFDFASFLDAEHEALLCSPEEPGENRTRVLGLVEIALGRAPSPVPEAPTLEELCRAFVASGKDGVVVVEPGVVARVEKGRTRTALPLPALSVGDWYTAFVAGFDDPAVFFHAGEASRVVDVDGVSFAVFVRYSGGAHGAVAEIRRRRAATTPPTLAR